MSLLLISIVSAIVFEVISGRAYEVLSGQQAQLSNNKLTLNKIENLVKQTASLLVLADLVIASGETYLVENTLNELDIIIERINKLKVIQLVAGQENTLEIIEKDLLAISHQIVEVDKSLKMNDESKRASLLALYDNRAFSLVTKLQVVRENATKKNQQLEALYSELGAWEKAKVVLVLFGFITIFVIVIGLAICDIDLPIKRISAAANRSLFADSAFINSIDGTVEIQEMSYAFSLLIRKQEAEVNKKEHALSELKNTLLQLKQAHQDSKNTNKKLKETQLQLIDAEKLETTGMLAAGVAHEVKNPLAIIQLSADYLKLKIEREQPDLNEMVDVIFEAVDRADSVIQELLDFNTKGELKMESEKINGVISEAIKLVKHESQKKNIKISTQYSDKTPMVVVDRNKILQVIINLAINAIRAMDKGGELILKTRSISKKEVKDEVTLSDSDQHLLSGDIVIINIIDNGPGISSDVEKKIFEPFFTTKNDGKGTGLGLTVVKNIMRLHGASISIKNNRDKGVNASLVFSTFEAVTGIENKALS
jgi:signal transduction histidine kinase